MKHRQLMVMGLSVLLTVSGVGPGYRAVADETAETVVETTAETPKATEAPKQTEAPKATEAPKQTEAPTTEAPKQTETPKTEAPTETPKTEAPTETPKTEAPTETQKPTETPTETTPDTSGTESPSETTPDTSGTESPSEATPDISGTESSSETPPQSGTTENPDSEVTTEGSSEGTQTAPETGDSEPTGTETGDSETVLTETELESETETYQETDKEGLIEEETEEVKREGEQITNEQLIARQNIVTPPDISLEFRFTQVEKVYAVVKCAAGTKIYEEKDSGSAVAGTIGYHGLCYILEDKNSDWAYVESGEVRGFISAEDIVTGNDADWLVKVTGEENLPLAQITLERNENDAYTYTHTTVYEVLANKVFAVAQGNVKIYEEGKNTARVVGQLEDGGLCYVLADADKDWVYVESGNARGFVQASELETGLEAIQAVNKQGELNMSLASVEVEPEDNKACYYTLTSVRKASQAAITRSDMVNYSFQFLGNPYVWGGTSLTNGCDCSGFTQSIYAHFGYSIPRVAENQAAYGMQIPVSSAAPGDLIFYARNGYVYHVSMYIGDGQVIHAAGTSTGITISGIGSAAVWATRIIQD